MSGPVPKRADQRRRRNAATTGGDVTKAPASEKAWTPPEPGTSWHHAARDWYVSLLASGQSRFYEPSDWQTAWIWAEILSNQLHSGKPSAVMIQAWNAAANELLTTEGARRRARLELEKPSVDEDEQAAEAAVVDARARFGA